MNNNDLKALFPNRSQKSERIVTLSCVCGACKLLDEAFDGNLICDIHDDKQHHWKETEIETESEENSFEEKSEPTKSILTESQKSLMPVQQPNVKAKAEKHVATVLRAIKREKEIEKEAKALKKKEEEELRKLQRILLYLGIFLLVVALVTFIYAFAKDKDWVAFTLAAVAFIAGACSLFISNQIDKKAKKINAIEKAVENADEDA